MISYERFWNYIAKREISQYALINEYGFSTNLIHRLKHGKPLTTTTLNDICASLDCTLEDILEYKKP